jgi:hypothetical protein
MKRRQTSRLLMEQLECRRCLAASVGWDGPGLGSATLNYSVASVPSGMNQQLVESTIATALKVWSDVADINFVKTTQRGLSRSLDFTFSPIDGSGGTLAQAYFPADVNPARIAGDVQFDSSESWEVGNALGSRAFDLLEVAVHEIGHALGLDHSHASGSVMADTVSPSESFSKLSTADIAAIRGLYAARTGALGNGLAGTGSGTANTGLTTTTTSTTNTATNPTTPKSTTPTITNNRFFWRMWWYQTGNIGRATSESLAANIPARFNMDFPADVDQDGNLTPMDALLVINHLNHSGAAEGEGPMVDCNGDGFVTPLDALEVINQLNSGQTRSGQNLPANIASNLSSGLSTNVTTQAADLVDNILADTKDFLQDLGATNIVDSSRTLVDNILDDVDAFVGDASVSNLLDSIFGSHENSGDLNQSINQLVNSFGTRLRSFLSRV